MTDPQAHYTQEEINEIIRRALSEPAARERALSHAELVEIAAEAGIERDALERATAELAQSRTQDQARQVAAHELAPSEWCSSSASPHRRSATPSECLPVLHRHSFTGGTWYVWPLLGSGALLALQVRHVIFPYDKSCGNGAAKKAARARATPSRARAWKQKFFDAATPWHRERRNSRRQCNPGRRLCSRSPRAKIGDHVERHERRHDRGPKL